jgi:hypothetical protein
MVLRADGNNETSVFLLLFFHGHLLISAGILIRKQLARVAERHGRLPRPAERQPAYLVMASQLRPFWVITQPPIFPSAT